MAIAREKRLEYAGEHYQIPFRGPGSHRAGKPIRTLLRPVRTGEPAVIHPRSTSRC